MKLPTAFQILQEASKITKWASIGTLLTVLICTSGTSTGMIRLFSLVSGFGLSLFLLFIVTILLFISGKSPGRIGKLARGDFENFHRWSQPKALRAASALIGMAGTTLIYGLAVGDHNGFIASALALLYSLAVWWCWFCISTIAKKNRT